MGEHSKETLAVPKSCKSEAFCSIFMLDVGTRSSCPPLLGIELGDPLLLEQSNDGYGQREDRGSCAVATTLGVKRHVKEHGKPSPGT